MTTKELRAVMLLKAESALQLLGSISRLAEETPLDSQTSQSLLMATAHLSDFVNDLREPTS